ncbi:tyrosine-type recombinase/integrase [Sphingomonas sp. Y38-1Y]|uniref:tyrosine-type recombinase/integrase n=1 Tax=Sphingomonas sp. Y38-1Y TaxID=3078265 RepID=UPI0028EBE24D|nr:tyrosine-type recombinase/integrase [Sphingomonas sp. Y38-1Y]
MPVIKLDAFTVQTLTCPPEKAKEVYRDTTILNFIVEVHRSGTKTYAYKYRDPSGTQRQFKIANVSQLTFAEAKKEAIRVQSRVVVGKSPQEERKVARTVPTVSQLSDRYLEYVRSYKKSADIDERYLRLHLLPRFGKQRINQLDRVEVMEWLAGKVKEGYAQATVNRWQVIFGHMLRMAKVWGIAGSEVNPLDGLKQKDPNNKVERFLTAAETQRLRRAVENSPNPMLAPIVALLLHTGCRKRELLDAKWEEFRLDQRLWRIPTSKTGKPRHVPLSEDAIAVIKALPRYKDCPYLLPNPKTLKPLASFYNSWDSARRAAGLPDVRVHDLRHSMASNAANAGQSLFVIGQILGHSQPRTTMRYAHLSNETLHKAANAASAVSGWNDSA